MLNKDHPRVGGEKRLHDASFCRVRGSPPRGRGKVGLPYGIAFPPGITPAWAGKRRTSNIVLWTRGDHPRVGGEKTAPRHLLHFARGSPPRGRGKD